MRRIGFAVSLLIVLLAVTNGFAQSTAITGGSALPAKCIANRNIFFKSGSNAGVYACTATNTWTRLPVVVVPVTDGGTGSAPSGDDQVLVSSSSSAAAWKTLSDCATANHAVSYDASTNAFGCTAITGGGGGGVGDVTHNGSLNGALALGDGTADITAYAGSSCTTGAVVTSINAAGVATCTDNWQAVRAASDQDISSNTSVANDNELFFTMAANVTYQFDLYLLYSSVGGATPDLKLTFNGPATFNNAYIALNYIGLTDTTTAISSELQGPSGVHGLGTNTIPRLAHISGWASSSTGGSGSSGFILQWAQNTSSGNATRRHAGSIMFYRAIS